MGKPHPVELRERVVAFVEEGHSHRSAAARFRVSVKFVNDMVILKRETGGLQPRRQGNGGGHGKLEPVRSWLETRMARKGDLTLDDLVAELPAQPWPDAQKKPSAPSNRSGLTSCKRAISESRGASPSCATCCRGSVSSMNLAQDHNGQDHRLVAKRRAMKVLQPLIERIEAEVMTSDLPHADDTPTRVLDKSLRDRGLGKGGEEGPDLDLCARPATMRGNRTTRGSLTGC